MGPQNKIGKISRFMHNNIDIFLWYSHGMAEKFSLAQSIQPKMYSAGVTDTVTTLAPTSIQTTTLSEALLRDAKKQDMSTPSSWDYIFGELSFLIIRAYVYGIRYWIYYVAVPFAHYYNMTHLASDGKVSNEGVSIKRNVVYGDIPGESMDVLSPSAPDDFILYVHGGGFVSVHRAVVNHSITPFVRAGFTVFSMDYPLAPNFKFPVPIVSVIKCLGYIKANFRVSRVKIVADSAGGCLASMAVGAIANPTRNWDPDILSALQSTDLPEVDRIVLLYTICDESSWDEPVHQFLSDRVQSRIMRFCLAQYRASPDIKVCISENIDKLDTYPATLLMCGHRDPLQLSHKIFHEALESIGVESRNIVVDGFHGFHGLPPPFSFGLWRTTVFPANCMLIPWLRNGCLKRVPTLPPVSWREYDVHLLVVLLFVHVALLYFAFTWIISLHTL